MKSNQGNGSAVRLDGLERGVRETSRYSPTNVHHYKPQSRLRKQHFEP